MALVLIVLFALLLFGEVFALKILWWAALLLLVLYLSDQVRRR